MTLRRPRDWSTTTPSGARCAACSPITSAVAVRRLAAFFKVEDMTLQRMDNVAIVVDDLDAAIGFFSELGMELEGKG